MKKQNQLNLFGKNNMNKKFMGRVGPFFSPSTINETYSLKYKLVVRGSNYDSAFTNPEVSVNDVDIVDRESLLKKGLHLVVINKTGEFVEQKYYDTSLLTDNTVNTIRNYIKSLDPEYVIAVCSSGELNSIASFDELMSDIGSSIWPGERYFKRFARSSYSAIISSKMKKIVKEHFLGNKMFYDNRSFTEYVFDTVDDLGFTGVTKALHDQEPEIVGQQVFSYDIAINKIKPNSFYLIRADMKVDSALSENKGSAIIYIKHVESATSPETIIAQISSESLDYETVTKYFNIGDLNSGSLKIEYAKTPYNADGSPYFKNVIMNQISRLEHTIDQNAAIGVNGMRINTMKYSDNILSLKDNDPDSSYANDYKEPDKIYYSNSLFPLSKGENIEKGTSKIIKLSEMNIKEDDVLNVYSAFLRDANANDNVQTVIKFFGSDTDIESDKYISEHIIKDTDYIIGNVSSIMTELVIPKNSKIMSVVITKDTNNGSAVGMNTIYVYRSTI